MEEKIKDFTELYAWQEGHKLVLGVYKITKQFPKDELFGLVSQMRRCAVSITSNIAEGFSRRGKDKCQFYTIAQGSATELQNQLIISKDINYLEVELFKSLFDLSIRVNKLIFGLIKSIKTNPSC